jgi:hypothetical protein
MHVRGKGYSDTAMFLLILNEMNSFDILKSQSLSFKIVRFGPCTVLKLFVLYKIFINDSTHSK